MEGGGFCPPPSYGWAGECMLSYYHQLHFLLEETSPKSYVSNISVRDCYEDGTPVRYIFNHGYKEAENGDRFRYWPLFRIEKCRGGYKLYVHNRRNRISRVHGCTYHNIEEAYFTARNIWIEMDADLCDDDLKLTDHVRIGSWVKSESVERFISKNKCENVQFGDSYRGKSLVWWDNYQFSI